MGKGYLVIEIQKNSDGTIAHIVTSFTDRSEAEKEYHKILMYASVSGLPAHTAVILSEEGTLIKKETYRHEEATA